MRTRQLKPGMKLDHPVVDRLGRNLVARGAELDDYMIDSLLKLGIIDRKSTRLNSSHAT